MPKASEMKRFTVSVEQRAYDALRQVAESQRPAEYRFSTWYGMP